MNQNGWGIRWELGIILLFIICLIIATIGINNFGLFDDNSIYTGNNYDPSGYDYAALESKLSAAAVKYYRAKYPNGTTDTLIISYSTLKNNGFISALYDDRDRECNGYAKVTGTGSCVSFIRCSRYRTSGYTKEYE